MNTADRSRLIKAANRGKVIVSFIHPPIPNRAHDWHAHFDNDEPDDEGRMLHGTGATEIEAIDDLLEKLNLDEDERPEVDLLAALESTRRWILQLPIPTEGATAQVIAIDTAIARNAVGIAKMERLVGDMLQAQHKQERELVHLRAALRSAIKIADEARDEWDAAPEGMKAGKLLIALSGNLAGYRADIDAIHAAIAKATQPVASRGKANSAKAQP